jgi:hypothetical protein
MSDTRTAASRVQSAEIRAWAADNGWPELKGGGGRIPKEARAAFEAEHGEPVEEEPEVSAMDEDDLDEEFEPGDTGVSRSQNKDSDPGPPADLDEARQRAGRDPEPAHLVRGRRGRPARQNRAGQSRKPTEPDIKVTKAVRDDITGKLAFWLSIPAEPWLRVDPYCGQAYADQVDEIAVKMAPLICLSPDMVRWFAKSSTFIMWTELGIAVRPVVEAIIAHHVTKRIVLDSNGEAVEVAGGGVDFSAYSARQPASAA